jgi:hypothetical protein
MLFSVHCFSNICYFVPPNNWQSSDPKKLSKYVSIGFVGKSKSPFKPSINLASEKTDATLKEYIKAIKNSYKNDKNATVREIGKLHTEIDEDTVLLEISKKSSFGDICLLQSVTKKNDDIFVLTGAVLKEELLKYKDDFFKAFKSIKITDNLIGELKENSQIETLKQQFKDLKEKKLSIKNLEKHIEENYSDLGSYWKILVLKQAYETIQEK